MLSAELVYSSAHDRTTSLKRRKVFPVEATHMLLERVKQFA
jgi:hypothetical protein